MIALSPSERRALRARAHSLRPVVSISQNGLSETVLAEIDCGLKAHELIKVRAYGIEHAAREALLDAICARLDAAPVQHIGNILIVYRARPDAPAKSTKSANSAKPAKAAKPARPPAAPRRRLKK
ncbi:MAG: YhbY family RNA-binding protein [Zoogloeaceae bacterium]|jgi:putative YhbY family RNA-binding protein|nr:YhbY family RNA-binding protein [Zoogloeaceae bacterium]